MATVFRKDTARRQQDRMKLRKERQNRKVGFAIPTGCFLTWLINEPDLYDQIKELVTPDDFFEEDFLVVARLLYQQLEEKAWFRQRSLIIFRMWKARMSLQICVSDRIQNRYDKRRKRKSTQ